MGKRKKMTCSEEKKTEEKQYNAITMQFVIFNP